MKQHLNLLIVMLLLALPALACGSSTPDEESQISTAVSPDAETEEEETDVEEEAPTDVEAEPTDEEAAPTDVEEEPDPTDEPEPTPEPEPTATPEPPQTANLGELFELGGYSFAVLSVEDPATPNQFYDPTEGTRLVAVEVIIGNVSADPVSTNPLDTVLIDSEGFAYTAETGSLEGGRQLRLFDLNPGERVRGFIPFEIPEAATPATVEYSPETFSSQRLISNLTTADGAMAVDSTPPLTASGEIEQPPRANLGDLVELDGFSFVALTVQDPTTPMSFYDPVEGTRVIAIEIVAGNVSGERTTVNPLDFVLVDTDGFVYETELGATEQQVNLLDIEPGERIKGWVGYQIPEAATPAYIKYETGPFGGPVLESFITTADGGTEANPDVPLTASGDVSRDPQGGLGQLIEQEGYSLQAEQIEDPATPVSFYDPVEGTRLVAVLITVGNVSGEEESTNPLDATLVDTNGYVYQAETGARDGQLELIDLAPGQQVQGWVAFTIPADAQLESIKYQISGFPLIELQTALSE